jgi:hypothetical protein
MIIAFPSYDLRDLVMVNTVSDYAHYTVSVSQSVNVILWASGFWKACLPAMLNILLLQLTVGLAVINPFLSYLDSSTT